MFCCLHSHARAQVESNSASLNIYFLQHMVNTSKSFIQQNKQREPQGAFFWGRHHTGLLTFGHLELNLSGLFNWGWVYVPTFGSKIGNRSSERESGSLYVVWKICYFSSLVFMILLYLYWSILDLLFSLSIMNLNIWDILCQLDTHNFQWLFNSMASNNMSVE